MLNVKEIWNGPRKHEAPLPTPPSGRLEDLLQKYPELAHIPQDKFPNHIAIILDGNGRWARRLGQSPTFGHEHGKDKIVKILREIRPLEKIEYVTLWALSGDNWRNREKQEIEGLSNIFIKTLTKMTPELMAENGQFVHIGRKDRISPELRDTFDFVERQTSGNTGQTIALAVDYGEGRVDDDSNQEVRLVQGVKTKIERGEIVIPSAETIRNLRDERGKIPQIDLVIRTGTEPDQLPGLSGLGRYADYALLDFKEIYLPDLTTGEVVKSILKYANTPRRGGGRPEKAT